MHTWRWLSLLLILGIARSPAVAQNAPEGDFKKLTLEELLDVNVTSVSRKAESLSKTAAAITVITAEDIRRTGVTSIPEALRLVPGLQVARFNNGSWAISARGFNSTAANKLLVLIDGRTVYSPLFSGTFWEVQDLILDDIARIEVVRGPGAALWGSNAVNGIINIMTKSAHQTKSNAVILTGGGANDLALGSFRSGGAFDPNTSYRAFAKYLYRDQMVFANGNDAKDSVRIGRTGFRVDGAHGKDEFTLQGDAYRGFEGIASRDDAKVLGGDVLGRWSRKISNTSELQVQAYYDRSLRRVPLQSDFHQRVFDIDLQHHFEMGRHDITWGAGYRWNSDTTVRTPVLFFVPSERTYPLETAFVQDEISLARTASSCSSARNSSITTSQGLKRSRASARHGLFAASNSCGPPCLALSERRPDSTATFGSDRPPFSLSAIRISNPKTWWRSSSDIDRSRFGGFHSTWPLMSTFTIAFAAWSFSRHRRQFFF